MPQGNPVAGKRQRSFYLAEDVIEALKRAAFEQDESQSEIVEQGLRALLGVAKTNSQPVTMHPKMMGRAMGEMIDQRIHMTDEQLADDWTALADEAEGNDDLSPSLRATLSRVARATAKSLRREEERGPDDE